MFCLSRIARGVPPYTAFLIKHVGEMKIGSNDTAKFASRGKALGKQYRALTVSEKKEIVVLAKSMPNKVHKCAIPTSSAFFHFKKVNAAKYPTRQLLARAFYNSNGMHPITPKKAAKMKILDAAKAAKKRSQFIMVRKSRRKHVLKYNSVVEARAVAKNKK